jgi:5-oxoprolinase (ATP-hydrolysing)
MTNHPGWGGSHLPDITVISPVKVGEMRFYLAARGHHADIGGITPGSMPAFSKYLSEEGAAVGKFQLVKDGEFNEV